MQRRTIHATGQSHRHPADQVVVPRHVPLQLASQQAVPVTVQKQSRPSEQRQPTIQPFCSTMSQSPQDSFAHPITGIAGQTDFCGLYSAKSIRPVLRSIPSIDPTASRTTPS